MSTACSSAEALFSPAIDDELDAESARGLRIHLDACSACAASFRRLRAALADLRELSLDDAASVPMRVVGAPAAAPRRSWRPRFTSAAAALLLIAIGGAGGAWYARASAPPVEQALAERGLSYGAGGWLPEVERLHRDRGEVWLNGGWRDRSAAVVALMRERDYEQRAGAWLPPSARETLAHGFVLGSDGWSSEDAVVAANLKRGGLDRIGHSWIAAEDRAGLRVDGKAVDAEQWLAQRLGADGYQRDAAGHWRFADDLKHEAAGEVRLGGAWKSEDDALAALMSARGYTQLGGRWTDPSHPAEPAKSEPERPAQVAMWMPVPRLPGAPESPPDPTGATALIQNLKGMSAQRVSATAPGPRPLGDAVLTGWRVQVGGAGSRSPLGTPAVIGGRVHLGGGIASASAYAFDATSGKIRWQAQMSDPGPSSPVPYGDDVVYTTESCSVYGLLARSGDEDFGRYLAGSVNAMPVTNDRQLLCAVPGPFLMNVDPTQSGRRWAVSLPSEIRTAPLLADGRVYGATLSGALVCWNAADGAEQWRLAGGVMAPPTRLGRELLVRRAFQGDRDGVYAEGLAVVDAGTGAYLRPVLGEVRPLVTAGPTDDTPQPLPANTPRLPQLGPAVASATQAVAIRGDRLEAVTVATGRLAWSVPLVRPSEFSADAVGTYMHSDPCIAGDTVIVGTLDGTLAAYELATGKRRWAVRVGPIGSRPDGSGGMVRVQPVVAAGKVYVTTLDGELVCVDTGDPSLEGPHWWGDSATARRDLRSP